jgi:ferrochelatase
MDGILFVAHGTIRETAELPAFLRRIRHGREPSAALVLEMQRRYDAIGGSPLLQTTREQAELVAEHTGLPTFVAMRLWDPGVDEALRAAHTAGISRLVVVPLAPFSVAVYQAAAERVRQAASGPEQTIALLAIEPWGEHPDFVAAQAELIARHCPTEAHELILTAHSLPLVAIRGGDRYAAEASACADAIGRQLGRPFQLAFQSEGADGGEWLGPSLTTVLKDAAARGTRHVAIAPFGFLADHVETLYDLDIEVRALCEQLELTLTRVPALNLEPRFIQALAAIAQRGLAAASNG